MAQELGMSLGKANYVLRALLGKGFVKIQNFRSSSNKRGYAYLLTPEGVAAKGQLTPLFSGYCFTRPRPDDWRGLLRTPGVLTLVKEGGVPARLEDAYVTSLRRSI